ncbi:MAG TPA: sulfite exporter TauE/SafE family protein [Thermoleophilaceae bacterium]|nr:sulfite exporter TauE/SafE family protein [Thermoleophilaceae bacterium]
MDPLIIVFGFGVGILVGLTGMGGGSLMTPILIIVFGYNPVTAVGTDLAYGAITKTVGGWRHFRRRNVFLPLAVWMGVGSVPAAIGGVYVLHVLEDKYGKSFDNAMLVAVASAVMLTGIVVLARALFMRRLLEQERDSFVMSRRDKVSAALLGLFVGFVLGVTSAGSGTLIAVGMILVFRLTPQRVVGTDVIHAAVLLWAASIAHVIAGNVDYGLMGTILIGSLPGVWIGSHLAFRVNTSTLRLGLAIVMIGSGLGLLSKAGAGIPGYVLAAVPAVLVLLVAGQLLSERAKRAKELASAGAAPPAARRAAGV